MGFTDWLKIEGGGGRNFEWPRVEQTIFRNLKIANVKNYEVQFFDFLIYELVFFFYLNDQLFDNFQNLIFFNFKVYLNQ